MLFQSPFSKATGHGLQALAFGHQHLKAISVSAAAFVVLGAGSAFAVSQANKEGDAVAKLATVTEAVEHLPISASVYENDFTLYNTAAVSQGDTNAKLLKRLGVSDSEALAFINGEELTRKLSSLTGRSVQVQTNLEGRLSQLIVRYPSEDAGRFTRLIVRRDVISGALLAEEQSAPLHAEETLGYATVKGTVYGAMDAAGIPTQVGDQLVEIFSSSIDFQQNLRAGDSFKIVYEVLKADDEDMGVGRVLGAEFINRKTRHTAVWFAPNGKAGAYYSLGGESLQKTYLAAPLKFTRISSGFGMRDHPVFGGRREHKGIDYAAPHGTPIQVVAEGTVKFSGWQNGYGNAVEIAHGNGRSTFYAHMSRTAVREGERVSQGQHIGDVGSTGWSTGPHLHFEYRIHGEYQHPDAMAADINGMGASIGGGKPLSASDRASFAALSDKMHAHFANAQAVQLAGLQ